MGQNISTRTSTRHARRLENEGYKIKYKQEQQQHGCRSKEIPTPVELIVPLLGSSNNNLLDGYTLNDLDEILQKHYITYTVSNEIFVLVGSQMKCFHPQMIKIGVDWNNESSSSGSSINNNNNIKTTYMLNTGKRNNNESAGIILNSFFRFCFKTPAFTNFRCISITTCRRRRRRRLCLPLLIDSDIFCSFLQRMRTNNDSLILFFGLNLSTEQGAVLASSCTHNNHLYLFDVKFDDDGTAFAQGLARNDGPAILSLRGDLIYTKRIFSNVCHGIIDGSNTRLKALDCNFDLNKEMLSSLCAMLRSSNSLKSLRLSRINFDYIRSLFQSLSEHPTLEYIHVTALFGRENVSTMDKITMTVPIVVLLKKEYNLEDN